MLNTARRYKMICQSPPWWLFCVWNVATVGIRRNCCGFPKERRRGHQICFDAHRWCSQGWQEGDAVAVVIVESLSALSIEIWHGCEMQIIMPISCTHSCFKVVNVVRGIREKRQYCFSSSLNFLYEISGPFFRPSLPKGILSIWSRLCLGTKYLGHRALMVAYMSQLCLFWNACITRTFLGLWVITLVAISSDSTLKWYWWRWPWR